MDVCDETGESAPREEAIVVVGFKGSHHPVSCLHGRIGGLRGPVDKEFRHVGLWERCGAALRCSALGSCGLGVTANNFELSGKQVPGQKGAARALEKGYLQSVARHLYRSLDKTITRG